MHVFLKILIIDIGFFDEIEPKGWLCLHTRIFNGI